MALGPRSNSRARSAFFLNRFSSLSLLLARASARTSSSGASLGRPAFSGRRHRRQVATSAWACIALP
eukprot:8151513-Pyramimonas_sp.AAC.1